MKKILITGANSYIGTSFEKYMQQWPEAYQVDTVDMLDGTWRDKSFAGYDVVFHVAGIAHSDNGKIGVERSKIYYRVNRDLAIETAEKAKKCGVKQFIFLSSMAVYGLSSPIGTVKLISKETPFSPDNSYGESKAQAEKGILAIADDSFKVVILRPPMIYGKNSKGNYPMLSKFAQKLPAFPKVSNQRSMLYIEHLTEFVRLMIANEEQGIFWPQNKEYSNTSAVVKMIAKAHGKRILLVPSFTWALRIISLRVVRVEKAFGSIIYAPELSEYKEEYRKYSLQETILKTEAADEAEL